MDSLKIYKASKAGYELMNAYRARSGVSQMVTDLFTIKHSDASLTPGGSATIRLYQQEGFVGSCPQRFFEENFSLYIPEAIKKETTIQKFLGLIGLEL